MSESRDLTPSELGCISLLKMFEEACDARLNTVTTIGSKEALEIVHKLETKYKICKVLRVVPAKEDNRYRAVFTVGEFDKYVRFMLQQTGLKLLMDGTLVTSDGMVIPNEYLKRSYP